MTVIDEVVAHRASWTRGVFVQTFDPGMAGIALEHKINKWELEFKMVIP